MKLNKQEEQLIQLIRNKYRYGTIVIKVQDGIPVRFEKAVIGINLGKDNCV